MKVLTSAEMRETDRVTSERYGIPSLDLMENAGRSVASFVLQEFPQKRKLVALCGRGNNGGDGLVAARYLAEAERQVTVLLLGEASGLSPDAKAMFERYKGLVIEIASELQLAEQSTLLNSAELILDAVVGTGFKPPLRGLAVGAHKLVECCSAPVVAVDLPSGWDSDSTIAFSSDAYRADAVVSFTAPKIAHVYGNLTRRFDDPVVVADIGSPEEAVQTASGLLWAGAAKKIADVPRSADANKGRFGHVLVIGGSRGKAGAAGMASLAALRTGAGLVTAGTPSSSLALVASVAPELMTIPLEEGVEGSVSLRNLEQKTLDTLLERKSVVALGPGLSQRGEASAFVREFLSSADLPVVIDADALNAIAGHLEEIFPRKERISVLTPHPGEMARLLGVDVATIQKSRESIARDFASRYAVILVLKGQRTLIAHPDGRIAVNTTGNPSMAKGGSGDILTGMIAAMLAQYPETPFEAVQAAVYLHGLAADFAVREQDQHTLLATDTVAHLFRAFRFRSRDQHGYVWIQGISSAIVKRNMYD